MSTTSPPSTSACSLRLSRLVWRHWIVAPLARGLTGFPLVIATLAMGLVGAAAKPASTLRRLAHRFGRMTPPTSVPRNARACGYGLAVFVPALLAFILSLLFVFLVWSGWLYPLKPDLFAYWSIPFTPHPAFDNAWGGPTLVGAWFIHAMTAIGMQLLCLYVISRLHCVQNVVASRLVP